MRSSRTLRSCGAWGKTAQLLSHCVKSLLWQNPFSCNPYRTEEMLFIPVSALEGDNIYRRSEGMVWLDGPTLIEALDGVRIRERDSVGVTINEGGGVKRGGIRAEMRNR